MTPGIDTSTVPATVGVEHEGDFARRPGGWLPMSGNPQTGPFYIEGAMVGDTIAVHFNKIRPNRDTAFQARWG